VIKVEIFVFGTPCMDASLTNTIIRPENVEEEGVIMPEASIAWRPAQMGDWLLAPGHQKIGSL